jgi:hypothetical protein
VRRRWGRAHHGLISIEEGLLTHFVFKRLRGGQRDGLCNEETPFRRIANMAAEKLGEEIKKVLQDS